MSLSLVLFSFSSLILRQISADTDVCNFWITEEDSSPVQLDTCYWRGKDLSYGYYCVENGWRGMEFASTTVVGIRFQAADCPGGADVDATIGDIYNNITYTCSEYPNRCHCDGDASLCETVEVTNCNDTYPIEETYVYGICEPRGAAGSASYDCQEGGDAIRISTYASEDCSGELLATPVPTPSPLGIIGDPDCFKAQCPSTEAEESGLGSGVVAVIVIAAIVGCIIAVVGVWYCMRKRQKAEQYFDSTAETY